MDAVLVFPKTKEIEIEDIDVPYSILFVGSYLSEKFKVKLFDERKTPTRKILQYIAKNKPLCVGISTMTGPQINFAINLSKKTRKISRQTKIVWGGVHPTVCPESAINEDYTDFVVHGEGEETFNELLGALSESKSVDKIKGIIYKKDGNIIRNPEREFMDIEKISLNWNLINMKDYISKKDGDRHLTFVTSRGCPFRCNYCWNLIVNKRRWRAWSAEKTKKELKKVLDAGVNIISFSDDNATTNMKRFSKINDFLKENNAKWFGTIRVGGITDENMKNMTNCPTLFIGAESGSQRMLDLIQKDIKVEDIYKSAIVLKKYNIEAHYSWMMGFPGEKRGDLVKTMKLIDRVHKLLPDAAQRMRIYNPYPGTPLFEIAKSHGFKPPKKLEGWANFTREYCVLDYIKNQWYLKCISYVTYFYFCTGKRVKTRTLYKFPVFVLKQMSKIRWKLKFFRLPIEFMFIEFVRRILNPNTDYDV